MEIKSRAEIMFFDDRFEKPTVILTGRWSAKDINKAGGLLAREFRRYIRRVQKGEVKLEETPIEKVEELDAVVEEEVSDVTTPIEEKSDE